MSAVSTSARLPKLAASRSAGGVARSSGEPGSGGSGGAAGGHRRPGLRVGYAADHVGDDAAVPVHRDLQAGFRSGGHHLVGRGLDLRLEVSHRP